ncbi:MAG: hypothetical protein KBG28_18595 [Kofleriaceae bacterium]|nr:hypothetical protein [Kofleriaceae bacterium]MBP9205991.1 hypothetical protein [Kofleriaceae bacterium]
MLFLYVALGCGGDEDGSYPDRPLQVANGGGGVVVSDDVPIDCGRVCQHQLRGAWDPITLRAVPDGDEVFLGWGGDCTGTGPCTLGAVPSAFVVAEFGPVGPVAAHPLSPTPSSWAYRTTVSAGAIVTIVENEAVGGNTWELVASEPAGADRWRLPLSLVDGGWPSLPVLESSGSRTVLAGSFFRSFTVGARTVSLPGRGCFFAVIDNGVTLENTALECGTGLVEAATWVGETLWLSGSFSGTMTIGGIDLVSQGGLDGFVAGRTAAGTWHAVALGGAGDDVAMAIAPGASDDGVAVLTHSQQPAMAPGLGLPPGLVLLEASADAGTWSLRTDLGAVDARRAELLRLEQGHVVAASFTAADGLATSGYSDVLLARLDASGAVAWRRTIASTGADRLGGISTLGDELLVAGAFQGILDLDGHQLAANEYSPFTALDLDQTNDGMILALSTSTGASSWVRQVGGPGQESFLDVATIAGRTFLVGGLGYGSTIQHLLARPTPAPGATLIEWGRRP